MREFTSPEAELRFRQRSLIPLNIFVALLSVIAALSILFLPLMRVDVDDLTPLLEHQTSDENANTQISSADTLSGTGLCISMTGMDFINLGLSKEPVAFLIKKAGSTLSENSTEIAAKAVVIAAAENAGYEVNENTADDLDNAIQGLEAADSDEAIDEAITSIINIVKTEILPEEELAGWDDAKVHESVRDLYDKTVEQTGEGNFTAEAFICVNLSEALNENGSGTGEVYTNFSDLVTAVSESSGVEEIQSKIPPVIFQAAAGLIALYTFVWALLFLFAFFHMFARNKRFMMWYVKLFGFQPCLIFGIVPLVATRFIPNATVAAAIGAISTLAWVSGACYLLLWFISIVWAFPIKHRIRKLNRELLA